jgi:hypothetical protein
MREACLNKVLLLLHRPYIDLTSTQHRPYINPTSTLHRPYIDPISTSHRPYIDPTSTLHRPYIDPTSKTSISRLLDADIPENYVAQLSGHKSIDSLQSYKSAGQQHQRKMSLTLSRGQIQTKSNVSQLTSCNPKSSQSDQRTFSSRTKTTKLPSSSLMSTTEEMTRLFPHRMYPQH